MIKYFLCLLTAALLLLAPSGPGFAQSIEERVTVNLPRGAGPFPVVILMHMTNGPGAGEQKWARVLNRNGFAAVTLKSYDSISGDVAKLNADLRNRIRHLQQAQAWVARQDWAGEKVSVIGRSHGAWAVFDAMKSGALSSKLHRAVASAPRCDGARGKTTRMRSRTPVLIVVGTRDRSYYATDCATLVSRISSGSVQLAEFNSGHSVDVDSRAATRTILQFLQ